MKVQLTKREVRKIRSKLRHKANDFVSKLSDDDVCEMVNDETNFNIKLGVKVGLEY